MDLHTFRNISVSSSKATKTLQNHSIIWVYEHLLCCLTEIIEELEATGSRELEEMLIKTNLKGLMIKILIN